MSLVLTRKCGETIKIGDDIYVTIGGLSRHGNVRVLIDAPTEIAIVRTELLDEQPIFNFKKQEEKK